MRVFELARELSIPARKLIAELKENGFEVKNHMSVVDDEIAELMRELFSEKKASKHDESELKSQEHISEEPDSVKDDISAERKKESRSEIVGDEILLDGDVTVQEFADLLGKPGAYIVGELIKMGKMLPLSATLEPDIAEALAERLGYKLVAVEEQIKEEIDVSKLKHRPPVVTVMGHVDHGKTTLLDAIRATQIAEREAGGITQHIGASWVDLKEGRIVFLDTPGHEAFTTLRSRGAQITDIVVLIVAADDGVMPQTIEAINHSRDAGVPIIVAINKIDKPNADVEKVKKDLAQQGLVAEEWGGTVQVIEISAKQRKGIDNLLEMILLQAELMDLKADYDCPAEGVIIESKLDKGKGPVATVLVKKGTLRIGNALISGVHYGKVRAMLDWMGNNLKSATPSMPVSVLGLSGVPRAGDKVRVVDSEKSAKEEAMKRYEEEHHKTLAKTSKITLDDLFSRIQNGGTKELKVIVKTDVQGSMEAVLGSFEKLGSGVVKINVIHSGIGAITDNDIMLASASGAIVIGFNVRPTNSTRRLAEREKVEIRIYRVIYDLFNDIKSALEGMLEPEFEEVVLGQAEIRNVFNIPKIGAVAGCMVLSGKMVRSVKARLIRDGVVVWEGKINTLRRFKDDVKEVVHGYECGIGLENFQDIKIGDIIECFEEKELGS